MLDKVLAGQLDIWYVLSAQQIVDGFTKAFTHPQFSNFQNMSPLLT